MSLRIAMVTSAYPDTLDRIGGGVEAVVVCLVHGILTARSDLDVHVIRTVGAGQSPARAGSFPGYAVHDVPARRSALGALPGLGPTRRIHKLLDALQPDVVHVQGEPTFIDGRRYPSVLTVHGFVEQDTLFADHSLRRLRSWVLRRRLYPARARFGHIIALTGYARQQLGGRCRRSEFHFVPNPIDSRFFDHGRSESGPVAFFAGRFRRLKNIHGLIEAVGLLAREGVACDLRLAGPRHKDAYSAHLDELIVRQGLSDRVVFLGHLDRQQLMQEMSRARCVVLPSFQESSPMVLPEAGAMGIGAVASPVGGVAELVSHEYSGILIDPGSPSSIAAGLRPLMQSAELADIFGERARQRAELSRPEVVGRKTLAVYERVIADWRGRRGPS